MHPSAARPSAGSTLVPLHAIPGARLAEGEPDIRGWHVLAADGRPLGVVDELLVDSTTSEVVALAVAAGGRLAVVTMSEAHLDAGRRTVRTELTAEQFAATQSAPAAGQAAGSPGVTVERTADGGEVITVPIVEEQLVVERRAVVKEVVVIRKRAVQEDRVVEADLRREHVDVEQRALHDPRDRTPGRGA